LAEDEEDGSGETECSMGSRGVYWTEEEVGEVGSTRLFHLRGLGLETG